MIGWWGGTQICLMVMNKRRKRDDMNMISVFEILRRRIRMR